MKKVIFQMSVSVDGYIEGPHLELGLMDELRIILTPIVLGAGKTVFEGITRRCPLTLLSTRAFKSGNVVLVYEPTRR